VQRPIRKSLRSWFESLTTLSKIEGRPIGFCLEENGDISKSATIELKCTNCQAANESA
jgi:hypothetical protein